MVWKGIQPFLRFSAYVAVAVVLLTATAWGFFAIYYFYLWPTIAGKALALCLFVTALGSLASYVVSSWRNALFTTYLLVFLGVVLWWSSIEPSNDRNWKTEVAVLPEVSWDGNLILLNTSMPFAELREKSRINEAARAAGNSADFSRLIRDGLPAVPRP